MDLLQALKTSAAPKQWVHFPNTDFELLISQLSTVEMQRLTRQAMKGNRLNQERFLELSYAKTIHGIRGMTLDVIAEKFALNFNGGVEKDGQPITASEVITSEPIEQYWLQFLIGLGKLRPKFHLFINEKSGQSTLSEDDEQEED